MWGVENLLQQRTSHPRVVGLLTANITVGAVSRVNHRYFVITFLGILGTAKGIKDSFLLASGAVRRVLSRLSGNTIDYKCRFPA